MLARRPARSQGVVGARSCELAAELAPVLADRRRRRRQARSATAHVRGGEVPVLIEGVDVSQDGAGADRTLQPCL